MTGYELSRKWFDWCFDNQEKIKPNHTALYFFILEQYNRMGKVEKFGLPTSMAMNALGIKSYNTYINTLNNLVEWGFIKMVTKSLNQYTSNIIALSNFNKATTKALDKALINHVTKQPLKQRESISSINKQDNKEQETKKEDMQPPYRLFKHLSLSLDEFEKLKNLGYTKFEIDLKLDAIENNKNNKNYSSLFLTAKNWLVKDFGARAITRSIDEPLDF